MLNLHSELNFSSLDCLETHFLRLRTSSAQASTCKFSAISSAAGIIALSVYSPMAALRAPYPPLPFFAFLSGTSYLSCRFSAASSCPLAAVHLAALPVGFRSSLSSPSLTCACGPSTLFYPRLCQPPFPFCQPPKSLARVSASPQYRGQPLYCIVLFRIVFLTSCSSTCPITISRAFALASLCIIGPLPIPLAVLLSL